MLCKLLINRLYDQNNISEMVTRAEESDINPIATSKVFEHSNMYGHCCCCRELPSHKGLWSEFMWMGQNEVYGKMIQECFNIVWPQSEDCKYKICEVCITQLRNALQFRQCIEQSHTALVDAASNIKKESTESNLESFDHDAEHETEMVTETYIVGDNPHMDPLQGENGTCNDTQDQDTAYKGPPSVKSESVDADGSNDTTFHSPPHVEQRENERAERTKVSSDHKEVSNNDKKDKEKKAKRSRRCQISPPSSRDIHKSDVTPSKTRNKDRHKDYRSNSVVENRYNDVPSFVHTSEDYRKEAAEQTNAILFHNDEAMTSPRTCGSLNPNSSTLHTPQVSQDSSTELHCLDSDFFEQVRKEAAKQANAFMCQRNVSLTSPKLTRLCLVRKNSNRTHCTPQGSLELPSSSYLKSLERELLEQIRKVALEQTKSIICQNAEAMTSPKVSQSTETPSNNSVHNSQEPIEVNSSSYVKHIESELFEQIRKIASEQTKALIIRNIEAMTSPRFTRSCFKPCIDSSMLTGLDNPQLECYTDDSYDVNANKN